MKNFVKLIIFLICFSSAYATTQSMSSSHSKHATLKHKAHHKGHKKVDYMHGIASYYGDHDGFAGQAMANGEIFNPKDTFSAAHPTLPLGTKLEVTNLRNGRSLYVEVRDRMPHNNNGRVIDLSVGAAKYLGMYHNGVANVKLTRVSNKQFQTNKGYLYVADAGDDGAQY